MQRFEYDVARRELSHIREEGSARWALGGLKRYLLGEPDEDVADRSKFFTSNSQLRDIVHALPIQLVEHDQPADVRSYVTRHSSLPEAGATLPYDELANSVAHHPKTAQRVADLVNTGRSNRQRLGGTQNWWDYYHYRDRASANLFDNDPTEQITIGQDQIEPVTIYNFSHEMTRTHIKDIMGGIAVMSALTEGHSRAITPYIIVHDAFKPFYFKQNQRHSLPAGIAPRGQPFIELRRSAFDGQRGSVGQPWLAQLYAHEQSHQIDYERSPNFPDFSNSFHYADTNGDGLIDYAKPHPKVAKQYDSATVMASSPSRDYGFTNGYEDFATVGEELPFGGEVDQIRRDKYIEIIEEFVKKSKRKHGAMTPLPERLNVEVARGAEIKLPLAEALRDPIRIRVGDNNGSGLQRTIDRILSR